MIMHSFLILYLQLIYDPREVPKEEAEAKVNGQHDTLINQKGKQHEKQDIYTIIQMGNSYSNRVIPARISRKLLSIGTI